MGHRNIEHVQFSFRSADWKAEISREPGPGWDAVTIVARDREQASRGAGPAVCLRDVSLTFASMARPVLEHVSFDIRDGEFLSIVGPSGCGKTTLLRMLAGLVRPSLGEITFDGQPITGPSRERAIVFQDYTNALLPWRTVSGNVALALERTLPDRSRREAAVDSLVRKMGLAPAAHQFPPQLSGGMQQRVQIARCLAQEPRILLMDEPFGALDAITRQTLQDELLALAAEKRMTTVFITHDLEEAIYLGDRVIVLAANPGRIAETIDVNLPRPRNQLTTREDARFLSHRHHLFGLLQGH
jgi:NitT/TauT family transport system ATP-binding protein